MSFKNNFFVHTYVINCPFLRQTRICWGSKKKPETVQFLPTSNLEACVQNESAMQRHWAARQREAAGGKDFSRWSKRTTQDLPMG